MIASNATVQPTFLVCALFVLGLTAVATGILLPPGNRAVGGVLVVGGFLTAILAAGGAVLYLS